MTATTKIVIVAGFFFFLFSNCSATKDFFRGEGIITPHQITMVLDYNNNIWFSQFCQALICNTALFKSHRRHNEKQLP